MSSKHTLTNQEAGLARGKFITLEGGEGSGKTTQAGLLIERLQKAGHTALLTREPGGTPRAETIRNVLLSGAARRFGPMAEAVLFYAARDSHLELTIRPALARGVWVICDRFFDSTRAYQGAAGGVSLTALAAMERIVVAATRPDLTFILDLPAQEGLKRARERAKAAGGGADRFESMDLAFHNNLRQEYLEIAEGEPWRCVVIDASQPAAKIAQEVWNAVKQRLQP